MLKYLGCLLGAYSEVFFHEENQVSNPELKNLMELSNVYLSSRGPQPLGFELFTAGPGSEIPCSKEPAVIPPQL